MTDGAAPDRRSWSPMVWEYLPVLALAPCLVLSLMVGVATPTILVVSGGVVVWHVLWVGLHTDWLEERLLPMAVYMTGLLGAAWWLKTAEFVFFPVLLSCFAMGFVALPGVWAFVSTAVTGVLTTVDENGLPPLNGPYLAIVLGGVGLSSVIGWTIRNMERQERRQREMRADLERAHGALQRAHERNLALQAELVREAHGAGVAAERARLAGEIHDTLAQGLAGVTAQLEAAEAELGDAHPSVRRVRLARDLARDSLREARRSVAAMRPGALDEGSFGQAVRGVVARWQEQATAVARLEVGAPSVPLHPDVEDVLLRALSECLANVTRHARAGLVSVSVRFPDDGEAVLEVRDDGVGFDPVAPAGAGAAAGADAGDPSNGYGLAALTRRAATLGGNVRVDAVPGEGTSVVVRLPARPDQEETP